MSPAEVMNRVDTLLCHVWMVRTFLKHSEEVEDDDELRDVYRTLYDYMHALGSPLQKGDAVAYVKQARKKLPKLRQATELFVEIQPEVSQHMNFKMASQSLAAAVNEISQLLREG